MAAMKHPALTTDPGGLAISESGQRTGTPQQLRDEGLIPDGFEFPAGRGVRTWISGTMRHSICRALPRAGDRYAFRSVPVESLGLPIGSHGREHAIAPTLPPASAIHQARRDEAFRAFMRKARGLAE